VGKAASAARSSEGVTERYSKRSAFQTSEFRFQINWKLESETNLKAEI
jgi:hypothetical protein